MRFRLPSRTLNDENATENGGFRKRTVRTAKTKVFENAGFDLHIIYILHSAPSIKNIGPSPRKRYD